MQQYSDRLTVKNILAEFCKELGHYIFSFDEGLWQITIDNKYIQSLCYLRSSHIAGSTKME